MVFRINDRQTDNATQRTDPTQAQMDTMFRALGRINAGKGQREDGTLSFRCLKVCCIAFKMLEYECIESTKSTSSTTLCRSTSSTSMAVGSSPALVRI